MQQQQQEQVSMEQGLKRQIIRQRTFKEDAQRDLAILLHENTKLALAGILKEEHVWNIVLKMGLWCKVQSSSVGVLSTIGDYTNKAGKTFKAHFTQNGYFLEKCKTENEAPKSYEGNFPITKESFRYQLNPDAKALHHLFVGSVAEVEPAHPSSSSESDDEEEPLSVVAKKITIRLNKKAAAKK